MFERDCWTEIVCDANNCIEYFKNSAWSSFLCIFFLNKQIFPIVMSLLHTFQYYLELFHSICYDKCAMKILHVWRKLFHWVGENLLSCSFFYLRYHNIMKITFNDEDFFLFKYIMLPIVRFLWDHNRAHRIIIGSRSERNLFSVQRTFNLRHENNLSGESLK